MDRAGTFHRIHRLEDARLAEIFGWEVLRFLVDGGLLSQELAERILSWRHTGFNVHSRVRARTKIEAERVGKYMVRPVLALDRLLFLDYLEFIRHLELTFVAEKPPPCHLFSEVALLAAEESEEYYAVASEQANFEDGR